jgi:hypothetical protein
MDIGDHKPFLESEGVTEEEFAYMTRNTSPFCKCGKYKRVISSTQSKVGKKFFHYCGDPRCSPRYGIKRPEHSKKMRELVRTGSEAYKASLMKRGHLHNKGVNTLEFKKKRLDNHNIAYNEDNIEEKFSELLKTLQESPKVRRKRIVRSYERWEEEFRELILVVTENNIPTKEWVDSLSDAEVDRIWRRIHGIATIRNWSKVKKTRNRFFKQEYMTGFKYNTKGQTHVMTRSGLEAKWILFFEEHAIPWCYEPFVLSNIHNDGFHIPDFLIEVEGRQIILEVKGSFYRQDIPEYFANKVEAAKRFAKENNMMYVLTQKQPSLDFSDALVFTE